MLKTRRLLHPRHQDIVEAPEMAFVMQALETRGLITTQNISVKQQSGPGRINTIILHLPRFKLTVQPGLIKVRRLALTCMSVCHSRGHAVRLRRCHRKAPCS